MPAIGVQVARRPFSQLFTVRWQAPTPQVSVIVAEPSSVTPLQSSSRPLQVSVALGFTTPRASSQSVPPQDAGG